MFKFPQQFPNLIPFGSFFLLCFWCICGPHKLRNPPRTGMVWMMSAISFSNGFWARIRIGSQSSLHRWPVFFRTSAISLVTLIGRKVWSKDKRSLVDLFVCNETSRLAGIIWIPTRSLRISHAFDGRWMPLMFAQGWIPALGSSRGKFLWEANKTGLGKKIFWKKNHEVLGVFSLGSRFTVSYFFVIRASSCLMRGYLEWWLEMPCKAEKTPMDESKISEDGWQIQPVVHQQSDRKWGS